VKPHEAAEQGRGALTRNHGEDGAGRQQPNRMKKHAGPCCPAFEVKADVYSERAEIGGPPQDALRSRLRELAASRVRFGYRRLTVMLRREGWRVNPKRIYRLYTEDGLTVRTKLRKKLARRSRVATPKATRPNQKWSMDFMSAKLIDGRWFRVLTVIDQFTRECLALVADRALNGHKVALALSQVVAERGTLESITVDNELSKKARGGNEHTSAAAHRASSRGYDCAIIECANAVASVSAPVKGSLAELAG
jgi:transposase InsO family protein